MIRRWAGALFALAYFLMLLPLLPRLSLWLDEILELHGVRDVKLAALPAYIASNAGAVPLGYVPQWLAIRLLGYSPAAGRLPSAVFAALSCFALFELCRRARLRSPLLAVAIFAFCPVQLRYAIEARTYAQAICLTILCTLALTYLWEKMSVRAGAAYFAAVLAGVYTQPFMLFVPLAHCLWLCVLRRGKLFLLCGTLTGGAMLCFLPWYRYASYFWRANVTQEHIRFVFRPKEMALIAHELAGAGYAGTILFALAILIGFRSGRLTAREKWFWAAMLAVPFAGPLAADAFFGYFLASRQFIFMLPAMAVLAAAGVTYLFERSRIVGAVAVVAIGAAWLAGDVGWFTKQREDWSVPSARLRTGLQDSGCAVFVPANSQVYFEFFEPSLRNSGCNGLTRATVWLAVSPYDTEPEYSRTLESLNSAGYQRAVPPENTKPHLEIFRRRP